MKEPYAIIFRIPTPSACDPIPVPRIAPSVFSYDLQAYVRNRVREIYQEARSPNWDEEGAKAISLETVLSAETFAQGLPMFASKPAIFAQHSGGIGLQWISRDEAREAVVVSMDGSGGITYATSGAAGKVTHGTEIFSGSPPSNVLESILHHFVELASSAKGDLTKGPAEPVHQD